MLGPIQSDAYRWDNIRNYSSVGLYEVSMTLQLMWEQTDGHYHDRLYVNQDQTGVVRVQTKDGSKLEDVRVVDMLKEQSWWKDSMVRSVTWQTLSMLMITTLDAKVIQRQMNV